MKFRHLLALAAFIICLPQAFAQVNVSNAAPTALVDFSNSMQTTVGTTPSTAFTGAGFQPNPTVAGRLNSNAWEVKGWSFGNLLFGGTQTLDDFGRGSTSTAVITPGIYAYTDTPSSDVNPALLIQPGLSDFDPGTITLKIRNNGTTNITQLTISYDLYVRNDEGNSSSINFSHSPNNTVFAAETALEYISPDLPDAFQWVHVETLSPSRVIVIGSLNLAPGSLYYIRWTPEIISGTGASDEFGLDDINITASYGTPAPEINVTAYGNSVFSGDTTPTVGEGTDYAPVTFPMSTLNTVQSITYFIQNLGAMPLDITNVTITGVNAANFTVLGDLPIGSIDPATAVISTRSLTITFDPSFQGFHTARINIFSNDSNENPYWFDIQGYGIIPVPDIRVNGGPIGGGLSIVTNGSLIPSIVNNTLFGPVAVGSSTPKNFIIRNDCPQNAPVLFTGAAPFVFLSGTNPGDFSITTPFVGATLLPGFTKNFTIQFTPTAGGIRSALVTIPNNDPDEGPFTFLVQGTGLMPEIDIIGNTQPILSGATTTSAFNHTFFDYLNVTTGTLDRTYTVSNTGTLALNLGAISISGIQAADFTVVTPPASSVAVGGMTTFVIRFDPSATGQRNAIVSIVNNDANENPYTFAVNGYGVDYMPCILGPTEIVGMQNFETTITPGPAWIYTTTGTPTVAAGTAYGAVADNGVIMSNRFLDGRSIQVSNSTVVVTMATINASAYADLQLNFRLAALASTAAEGLDALDRVIVAVSTNGGATYSNEVLIQGNTNSKWSFASGTGTINQNYDGDNISNNFNPGGGGYITTNGFSTITLGKLPKSTALRIKLTINCNLNEIWAIDNIVLNGRKEMGTTWNGTAWSANSPTSSIKAIFNGDYNSATFGNVTACKCEINAGKTVTISPNTTFSIESDIDNKGVFQVENNAVLIQKNDFAVNTGAAKIKRFSTPMRRFDYTYWSSPVAGQTLFSFSPLTLSDKYFQFDPIVGNWVNVPNSTTMAIGKGYIIRAPQTFDIATPAVFDTGEFNGVPNNGFIQTPIALGASNLNLIGNPYPSALSANAFLSFPENASKVEGTIYLWTHNTPLTNNVYSSNDYAVYNFSGSVSTSASTSTGVNTQVPTGKIASGQSFFIKGLANGNVSFYNNMRLATNNNEFFRQNTAQPASHIAPAADRLWLNLTNTQGAFKQLMVGYHTQATNGYDRGFDGEVLNGNSYVNFYTQNSSKQLAIQTNGFPWGINDNFALGYKASISGNFAIGIDRAEGLFTQNNIYLEDTLLQTTQLLNQGPYTFYSTAGEFTSRFILRFLPHVGVYSKEDAQGTQASVFVQRTSGGIVAISTSSSIKEVVVFDLLGRVLREQKSSTTSCEVALEIPTQVILVKTYLNDGTVSTSKVLY
ncbi:MAG: choice-of-anchor D domain-containing protein [Flavobacterium sp.]